MRTNKRNRRLVPLKRTFSPILWLHRFKAKGFFFVQAAVAAQVPEPWTTELEDLGSNPVGSLACYVFLFPLKVFYKLGHFRAEKSEKYSWVLWMSVALSTVT